MALGDLMASRFSQSTVLIVPNHHDDPTATAFSSSASAAALNDESDFTSVPHRRDSEFAAASSSSTSAYANAATTMAYLPQTSFFNELRHDAFELELPSGPSDSGLVSKWRPKDKVC
jgi:regulator-associated protein of mTOR